MMGANDGVGEITYIIKILIFILTVLAVARFGIPFLDWFFAGTCQFGCPYVFG